MGLPGIAVQQGQQQVLKPVWQQAGPQAVGAGQGYMQQVSMAPSQLQLQQIPRAPAPAAAGPQQAGFVMTALPGAIVHQPTTALMQQQAAMQHQQQQATMQHQQQQQMVNEQLHLQPIPPAASQQQHMPVPPPPARISQPPPPPKAGAVQHSSGAGGAGAGGPRPMKRQAYQALQGSAPKRQQYSSGRYNRSGDAFADGDAATAATTAAAATGTACASGDADMADAAAAAAGDDGACAAAAAANGGARPSPAKQLSVQGLQGAPRLAQKPYPGAVQLLADAQELISTIMQYMVKHKQFSSSGYSHAQGFFASQHPQQQVNGYDLCRFKQDFMDKYKYELVHRDVGFAKVKELIVWLMGDAVEVRTTGNCNSHIVLYPLPGHNYGQYTLLDCDNTLEYFKTHTEPQLAEQLRDVQQQLEQYQQKAAEVAAAAAQNGAAANGAAGAVDIGTTTSVAGSRLSEGVPGLNMPLSQQQLEQQQQLPPKQKFAQYLRRQLIELRVAARRTAVAEAWTSSYMKLEELVDSVLGAPQQGHGGPGPFSRARQAAAGSGAAAAAAGGDAVKDDDSGLLKGLDDAPSSTAAEDETDEAAATAAAGAVKKQEVEEDDKAVLHGLEQDGAAAGSSGEGAEAATATAAAAGGEGHKQQGAGFGSSSVAPGMRARAASSVPHGGGDSRYQAGLANRAQELLQHWPLLLSDLLAGFAAEQPEAHQQLMQVGTHVLCVLGVPAVDIVPHVMSLCVCVWALCWRSIGGRMCASVQ